MKMLAAVVSAALLFGSGAKAASNLLFILDSSNSMWGRVNGVAKMETARSTLTRLIAGLPQGTRVGLMAYGHRRAGDCADVELLTPVGENSAEEILAGIAALRPTGKTPIAASLEAGAAAFAGAEGPKSVVLISDGVETCNGDPCSAAGKLAATGVDVRVHVVGFDLTPEERVQLECIAEKGKGRYFGADSIEGFTMAVTEAVEVAQAEAEPAVEEAPAEADAAAAPVREIVWLEEFDGLDLEEPWTVLNPNPDNYIVEEGALLMLATGPNGFDSEDSENLILREERLPRGDWDLTVRFRGEFRTGADEIQIGLRKDARNALFAAVYNAFEGTCRFVGLRIVKMANGKSSQFRSNIFKGCYEGKKRVGAVLDAIAEGGAALTFSRRGRSYFASLVVEGGAGDDGTPRMWSTSTDKLTSLRAPGEPTLTVTKTDARKPGETLVFVERVMLVAVAGER